MQKRQADTKSYWDSYQQFQANARGDYENAVKAADAKVRMGTFAPQQAEGIKARAQADYDKRLAEIQSGPTYQLLQNEFIAQRDWALNTYNAAAPKQPGGWADAEGYGTTKDANGDIIQTDLYGNRVELGVISGGEGSEPDQFEGPQDPGMVWVEGGGEAGGYWDTSAVDNQGVQWNPDGSIASGQPDWGTYGGGNDPQGPEVPQVWQDNTPADTRDPFSFAANADEYYGGLFGEGAEPNNLAATGEGFKARRAGGAGDNTSGIGVGKTYSWY